MQPGMLRQADAVSQPAMPAQSQPTNQQAPVPQDTSDEQSLYETVVGQSAEFLYGDGAPMVQQRLGVSDDPAEDIGAVVGYLLLMNLESAMENKKRIPPRVVIQAAMELSFLVAEIAVQQQVMTDADLNREAVEGFYEAIKTFGAGAGERGLLGEDAQEYSSLINEVTGLEQRTHPADSAQSQANQNPTPNNDDGRMMIE